MLLCEFKYVIGDPSTPSRECTTNASKIIRVMSSIWVMLETGLIEITEYKEIISESNISNSLGDKKQSRW
jgi:hypothetical protein